MKRIYEQRGYIGRLRFSTGIHRYPLPRPFELPGYSPYSYW